MWKNPPQNPRALPSISGYHFQGYIGDIRSLARRTLPRNPPNNLLSFFDGSVASVSCSELALSPVNLIKDSRYPRTIPGGFKQDDNGHELEVLRGGSERSTFQYFPLSARLALHNVANTPSADKPERRCTKTKVVLGVSLYLALIVLVLIITVAVLASSLSASTGPASTVSAISDSSADSGDYTPSTSSILGLPSPPNTASPPENDSDHRTNDSCINIDAKLVIYNNGDKNVDNTKSNVNQTANDEKPDNDD
ncbi:hypothetical protein KP79_PYT00750 [Mizuhopecten yessoensis]|uniref:Uncharacterized protein n=1 Tax=Mizuhopecten yessoensis TaxID=6573 RepID=A0A210QR95_MIZYE|nr:hypothetical protein KP79_PYT00750 [Mizuhopecten yessoensis]